jgi:hypothetical protein
MKEEFFESQMIIENDDRRFVDKVIFLDVDGVLNTDSSRGFYIMNMVPDMVRNLEVIVRNTGAYLVISSDWRHGGIGPDSDFQRHLKFACIKYGNVQMFDYLVDRIHGKTLDLGLRQKEIYEYAEYHGIKRFIALDDYEEHFPDKPDWLVLTDDRDGLTDAIVGRCIDKLGRSGNDD